MKGYPTKWLEENNLVEIRPGVYGRKPKGTPLLTKALGQSFPPDSVFSGSGQTKNDSVVDSVTKGKKSNTGLKNDLNDKFDFNTIEVIHEFDILPCPAPRMTQSDRWKTNPDHEDPRKRQRPPVTRYFAFKNRLKEIAFVTGYELPAVLNIMFIVPMPMSWSKTKQFNMNHTPHMSRPDRDNYLKAFQDTFDADDGYVWDGRTIKLWGFKEKIIIFK